jgi:hypothetical protein
MRRVVVVSIVAILLGCNKNPVQQTASENAPATKPFGPEITYTVETTLPTIVYPEKTDVERLLITASELELKGNFADALETANRALVLDPNSPRAAATKQRLEDRLRRI